MPGAAAHANGFIASTVQDNSGSYDNLVGIWPAELVVGNLDMAIGLTSERGPVTDAMVDVRGRIGQKGPAPVDSWNTGRQFPGRSGARSAIGCGICIKP